MKSLYKKQKN